MTHRTTTISVPEVTIGVDVGDRVSHICILNADGDVRERTKTATTPKGFRKFFAGFAHARVAYEVGAHSPWITLVLESLGCETIVSNARKAIMGSKTDRKNDSNDAESLARVARLDPKLLWPIQHRGPEAQADRALLHARDQLVRTRTALVNFVRGIVKPFGSRVTGCSAASFHRQAPEKIPPELRAAVFPIFQVMRHVSTEIRAYDRMIIKISEKRYPETARLQQVTGVGYLTALAFVLAIEDPTRFRKSRHVGPFFGLVPRQHDSGDLSPQLRITKAGDKLVRRLLVSAGQYILGPFGTDSDLRRYGEAIAKRGGKNAKKRAVVAVARKLAVLLHRLWITGAPYEPLCHQAAA